MAKWRIWLGEENFYQRKFKPAMFLPEKVFLSIMHFQIFHILKLLLNQLFTHFETAIAG